MKEASVVAWDGPTRVFKWALVFVVVDGWISNKYGGGFPTWHKLNGYTALVLIVFVAVGTYYFHDFWNQTGPDAQANLAIALKNLSLVGGLLIIAGIGRGGAASSAA